jgi:hypothetical protein
MFDWFRKRKEKSDIPLSPSTDAALRRGVDAMVAFLHAAPTADDEAIVRHVTEQGMTESQATKLVQFVPIAFTRFLYRSAGVRFAPDYVVLGSDGQIAARRMVATEPAFREAWSHCEEAATRAVGDEYFISIAARSGGYRALQDLIRQGSKLAGIMTSPPIMMQ